MMILEAVPVIPPELRPMVQLDGGRFATSDLNDLYRRVINRNNRLKRLLDLGAPEIIVNNEKRMLQEAVDALFDNGRRGRPVTGPGNRALKSLSDMLKGKQGRFRQNLLGKRVDYSGRSVIVAGPSLRLHQCGLPKLMALELFKPFIMARLVERKAVQNIKAAKKMVDSMIPEVWDVLEEVIHEHPVLLNRAPTLHRLGIQAFEPVLVEGKAIQVHPLVCHAFNADFDGDQMAVHLPLVRRGPGRGARADALVEQHPVPGARRAAGHADAGHDPRHLLPHRTGRGRRGARGDRPGDVRAEGRTCSAPRRRPSWPTSTSIVELHDVAHYRPEWLRGRPRRHHRRADHLQRQDRARAGGDDGRGVRPLAVPVHQQVAAQARHRRVRGRAGAGRSAPRRSRRCSTRSRTSASASPPRPASRSPRTTSSSRRPSSEILASTRSASQPIQEQYEDGLITQEERHLAVTDQWNAATDEVAEAMIENIETTDKLNSIYMMASSGARGSFKQIRQLAGMRGLMANPKGEIIERPVKANFMEGLDVHRVLHLDARRPQGPRRHRAAHGRLGLPDPPPGGRRAGRDHPHRGLRHRGVPRAAAVQGRRASPNEHARRPRARPRTSRPRQGARARRRARRSAASSSPSSSRRSTATQRRHRPGPLRAQVRGDRPACARRATAARWPPARPAMIGDAVGIIAAQSIGEPGTQLTMRTFHTGGVAGADITHGLPRIVELFEARKPKGLAKIAEVGGVVSDRGHRQVAHRRHHRRRRRGAPPHVPAPHAPARRRGREDRGRQAAQRGLAVPARAARRSAAGPRPRCTSSRRSRRSTSPRAWTSTTSTSS